MSDGKDSNYSPPGLDTERKAREEAERRAREEAERKAREDTSPKMQTGAQNQQSSRESERTDERAGQNTQGQNAVASGKDGTNGTNGKDGASPDEKKSKKWYNTTAGRVGLVALAICTLPYSIYAVAACVVVAAAGAIVYGAAVGIYKGVKAIKNWFNKKKGSSDVTGEETPQDRTPTREASHEAQEHTQEHARVVDPVAAAIRRSSSVGDGPPKPPARIVPPLPRNHETSV